MKNVSFESALCAREDRKTNKTLHFEVFEVLRERERETQTRRERERERDSCEKRGEKNNI